MDSIYGYVFIAMCMDVFMDMYSWIWVSGCVWVCVSGYRYGCVWVCVSGYVYGYRVLILREARFNNIGAFLSLGPVFIIIGTYSSTRPISADFGTYSFTRPIPANPGSYSFTRPIWMTLRIFPLFL